jgi:hypothetical protein
MSRRLLQATLAGVLAAIAAPPAAVAADAVPDGLYVGDYQEDPLTNPEDPTMGSVYLALPASDGGFAGSMSFTYVGCQSDSVGSVTGTKSTGTLKGVWAGSVDGTAQHGAFSGTSSSVAGGWVGEYTVAGGKQHVAVPSCISYFIAPKGTFELFPVGAQVPASFAVDVVGHEIRWTSRAGVAMTLVYVLDPELAKARDGHAARWQTLLLDPSTHAADLNAAHLKPGHVYIAVVSTADAALKHTGFASRTFVAP